MKLTLALVIGLALWPHAARQGAGQSCDQHADRVYTTKEVDEKAKVTYRHFPLYPEKLRSRRMRGETKLRMVFRPDGRVTDIEVLESNHEEFSKASVDSARRLKFEPAKKIQ